MEDRLLVVLADDYGIGPETSRGIRELAAQGVLTATVLLVNSPQAERAIRAWQDDRLTIPVGWHPCLTLDRPVAPASQVPSLVDSRGLFWNLPCFLTRLMLGRIRPADVAKELNAQYERFIQLLGHPPCVINAHQHITLFPPVDRIFMDLLTRMPTLPYVRRVREPWNLLSRVPDALLKRAVLNLLGRRQAHLLDRAGVPGNDCLAGITNPACTQSPDFFSRWLRHTPGQVVELMCHPGHLDRTLVGRDGDVTSLSRRVNELSWLSAPTFLDACQQAGFLRVPPSALFPKRLPREKTHVRKPETQYCLSGVRGSGGAATLPRRVESSPGQLAR